ncbi:MAG TPA: hypothetical protein VHQ66_11325, partial [Myxococcota bacterium]|nr:hypothetical protein [Myxococcota bacterium]
APADAPALAARAADGWTAASERLLAASAEGAPAECWADAAALAREVADVEQSLFERLAG